MCIVDYYTTLLICDTLDFGCWSNSTFPVCYFPMVLIFFYKYAFVSSFYVVFCVVNNNWSIRYIDITVVLQSITDIANIDYDIDFRTDIAPL